MLKLLGHLSIALGKLAALCEARHRLGLLKHAGRNVSAGPGLAVYGPEYITIEDDVVLARDVTLRALTAYPWSEPPQVFRPELVLRQGCFLNNGTELSAAVRIEIGRNVMFGPGCFVTDNAHGYEDVTRSPRRQPLRVAGEVVIGEDSWLGAHVCVAGRVRIGRHVIVGANAVVTRDLPDFCLAVGAPARIVRRYDPEAGLWRATQPSGEWA